MPVAVVFHARLTWHACPDRVVDWHPDGNKILFASGRESGTPAYRQFYLVSTKGGLPEKLPVPYGELASFSPDGNNIAYVTKITENYPFKRYCGGFASDVLIYDLKKGTAENITKSVLQKANLHGTRIRSILYRMPALNRDGISGYMILQKNQKTQLTNFDDVDINHMSAGPMTWCLKQAEDCTSSIFPPINMQK